MIAYRPFENTTGQKNGVTFTVGDVRKMNLWISSREEAERLLQGYVTKNNGENAVSNALGELIAMGLNAEASQMASTETAKLLPASYAVTGEGQLGTLPITAKLRSETTAELTSHINEIVDGQQVVRAFSKEDDSLEKFDEINGRLGKCSLQAIRSFRSP